MVCGIKLHPYTLSAFLGCSFKKRRNMELLTVYDTRFCHRPIVACLQQYGICSLLVGALQTRKAYEVVLVGQ